MYSTGNEMVDQVGMINIEGNIIPFNWFSVFKFEGGKPDLNSIIILSEIVYWYRPKILRDENTGATLGIGKKFKADLLQRSYESFANQFGISKRQVKESFDRLCESGVVERVFRSVKTDNTVLSNVLFIKINPEVLSCISNVGGHTFERTTPPRSKVGGHTFERGTYTEITTEITTENKDTRVQEIFDFWKTVFNKDSRSKVQGVRERKIQARLNEGYSVDEIKKAITNVSLSDYHVQGGYIDLELICRNQVNLDKYIAMTNKNPEKANEQHAHSDQPEINLGSYKSNRPNYLDM